MLRLTRRRWVSGRSYVDCVVNGVPMKAFVDCGAQMTIMTVMMGPPLLEDCQLLHPIPRVGRVLFQSSTMY